MVPTRETDTLYWFSPAIERDLITSWWCTGKDYGLSYPHADGGFPSQGAAGEGGAWASGLGCWGSSPPRDSESRTLVYLAR